MTKLSGTEVAAAGLTGWVNLVGGLQTRIKTGDFAAGLALVNAIGAAAEKMNHHPDLDLRYPYVDVRLSSHDVGGITERDIELARTITALAADAGAELDGTRAVRLELALDTPAHAGVRPFWQAVLAMEAPDQSDDELRDPDDVLPLVWFQSSGSEEPRQRWHFDVWVDPAQVQPRIDAALSAGGTVVSEAEAPSFWVLADPEGNRMCLCTWQERGAG